MRNLTFHFQYDLVGETDRKGDRDPKKRAADIIAKLDVSGDKKLSKAEFTTGYILLYYKSLFSHSCFFLFQQMQNRSSYSSITCS